ncbi:MAG TPA: bifunctional methylenetetrahydrofolate dehydrogenase/methenyltetrahydrofolate cyclohydrolase FolD [Acidobacteriaceae bacterium]|jgi:methylenetetrahydrofolate dehydrogenase (NADP+) / methenyltetrahydrofolate cyclohydrolase|nr:bifunctional methylenetetrahydrofolate dehydrogenase/methenyltetrahydrofolate cyclohydrolase FolD [Acidobacteriaceae bacterium]
MAGLVLDGKAYAKELEAELTARVERLALQSPPVLATILVGDDPASATYVRMKGNACRRVGMESLSVTMPGTTTTDALLAAIDELNANPRVLGILLQHPVPKQIDERACFDRIALEKDVDGVTTQGFGRMAMDEPAYGSATPAGIMRLLKRFEIAVVGREAVVVGRSPILGRPMAMMLLAANATVTICHSRTKNLAEVVGRGEIVVGAVGKPEFIRGSWIRDGAVVVDAGYHPGGVGDIELAGVIDRCSAYTPVPGGVGPMTIATLIAHTVEAAERAAG